LDNKDTSQLTSRFRAYINLTGTHTRRLDNCITRFGLWSRTQWRYRKCERSCLHFTRTKTRLRSIFKSIRELTFK